MADQEVREKVVMGLECRLDINGSKYKHCLTCDYRHDIDHCQWACQTDGILEDALALLKEQEPVIPKRFGVSWFCGNCKTKLVFTRSNKAAYCWRCGKAVKWE